MGNWKQTALSEAISRKVCDEYRGLLEQSETLEDAIRLYKTGVDWSLENSCPSLELLRSHKDELEKFGIFIDKEFNGELLNDEQTYIFHNCKGSIRVGLNIAKKIIPMLYFANECSVMICADEDTVRPVRVPVHLFGHNPVFAETSDKMVCLIRQKNVK